MPTSTTIWWDVAKTKLPVLRREVEELLSEDRERGMELCRNAGRYEFSRPIHGLEAQRL